MFDQARLAAARRSPMTKAISEVDLVLTVTSGRSGTKLLTALCGEVMGVSAEHEPAPRANFALRPALVDPHTALDWLVDEKFPTWLRHMGTTHLETSHLYCKGLLEPILALGLRPRLILLRRPATEVAASLFQLDVVPGRTEPGNLVLLRPDDAGVLPLREWESLSDYALCYWYALEIERRQALYDGLSGRLGLRTHRVAMSQLVSRAACLRLAAFLGPGALARAAVRRAEFSRVTRKNQNRRIDAHPGQPDRPLPPPAQRRDDEEQVLLRTQPNVPGLGD